MSKSVSALKQDLEAIRELVETSNPDANLSTNRFYTFLDNTLDNISTITPATPVASTTGWANYQDSLHTAGSPLALSAGVKTLITNDKSAPTTDESHLPPDVTGSWWDAATNTFTPTNEYDAYTLRLNFATQTSSGGGGSGNAYLDLALDIGGGIGEIWNHIYLYVRGSNITHHFSTAIPLYVGATFIANGGKFYATASTASSLWDVQLVVIRNYTP